MIVLVALLGSGEVAATRVFHQRLEEVLTAQTPVILARVRSCQVDIQPQELRVVIALDEVQVIHLRGPAGPEVVYAFSTEVERQVDGGTVRVSPLREGSGIEQRLQAGLTYYFLLDSSGQFVRRVEPESSGPAIRSLLSL